MGRRQTIETEENGTGWIELSREVKAEMDRLVYEEGMRADSALLEVIRSDG